MPQLWVNCLLVTLEAEKHKAAGTTRKIVGRSQKFLLYSREIILYTRTKRRCSVLIEYSKNINFFCHCQNAGKKTCYIHKEFQQLNNPSKDYGGYLVSLGKKDYCGALVGQLAVIAVEPAGKSSFVYSCMQARLLGQNDRTWHISLVLVSKPLTAVITAIDTII